MRLTPEDLDHICDVCALSEKLRRTARRIWVDGAAADQVMAEEGITRWTLSMRLSRVSLAIRRRWEQLDPSPPPAAPDADSEDDLAPDDQVSDREYARRLQEAARGPSGAPAPQLVPEDGDRDAVHARAVTLDDYLRVVMISRARAR